MFIVIVICLFFVFFQLQVLSGPGSSTGSPSINRREFLWDRNPNQVLSVAKILFSRLETSKVIHEWVYIIRQSRHPNCLWDINYIKPTKDLQDINKLLLESEKILFENENDITLKQQYYSSDETLSLLNILRGYIIAESGDIHRSLIIWNTLFDKQISNLNPIRQSNLLCHLHSVFLCSGDFEKSYACYLKHLTLMKTLNLQEQWRIGIWDNAYIISLLQWFFCNHVQRYNTFMSNKIGITERLMLSHKKSSILPFTPMQLIVQTCSKPFYDYARTLMSELPSYDESEFVKAKLVAEKIAASPYEIKYKEMLSDPHASKAELAAIEWSMYHEKEMQDLAKCNEKNKQYHDTVLEFIDSIDFSYHSVVDLGCGVSDRFYEFFTEKQVVGVDISPYVVDYWKQKGRQIVNTSIETFFQRCDEKFDLCFAASVLPAVIDIDAFLHECSKKCKYLFTVIYTGSWMYPGLNTILNLANTTMSKDEWLSRISKHFEIQFTDNRKLETIMLLAKSKNN